jgi:predicted amidophosphoribosyltransferase
MKMARFDFKHCNVCNEKTNHTNGKCDACWKTKEDKRIKDWEAMSVDEKLTNMRERMERMERGTVLDG